MDEIAKTQLQLRRLAVDQNAKRYVLNHPLLYQILLHGAADFIAGETIQEAVVAVREANARGHGASIDFMGENIDVAERATQATEELLRLIDQLDAAHLNSSLSFDLTHIGLAIDETMTLSNLLKVAHKASTSQREVMISAETADRTDAILGIFERANDQQSNVGITLQAYLNRTESDLRRILPRASKIRIVKGAFEALPGQSIERGPELNERFARLAEITLIADVPLAIATHDQQLQDRCLSLASADAAVEVEHLKHIAEDRLAELHAKGVATRLYVTYGREWFLYACNRLAEHPPNIVRALGRCIEAYLTV